MGDSPMQKSRDMMNYYSANPNKAWRSDQYRAENDQRGLIREFISNFKPSFYPCTFFCQPHPLPEGALSAAGPLMTALYTTEREG